ncbi:MAG TPA: hypothetical protein VMU54_05165 [Planctomycetota bacterium]|nr:hypothetical protein [Planctomycetota bacterium]
MGSFFRLAGRFLSICALGLWLAGFTVYTAFVIPIGHRQVSSGRFGFVTGEVTSVLNVLAAVAAGMLLFNLVAERAAAGRRLRWALVGTWILIVASLVVLVVLHSKIDGLLDYKAREISNQERFQLLHERYELVATVQWAAGLAHLWCALASWRNIDRSTASSA